MIQINLLPWREELYQIRKMQFITALVSSCIFSLLIILILHIHYSRIANDQNSLNDMLSTALNEEQGTMNEISSKADEANATATQLKFIIDLYNSNYRAVRLLNELVSLVPHTIQVQGIKRNGNQVRLSGMAKSEDDVTELMNNIGKSPYFKQPLLLSINVGKSSSEDSRNFNIMFEQEG